MLRSLVYGHIYINSRAGISRTLDSFIAHALPTILNEKLQMRMNCRNHVEEETDPDKTRPSVAELVYFHLVVLLAPHKARMKSARSALSYSILTKTNLLTLT